MAIVLDSPYFEFLHPNGDPLDTRNLLHVLLTYRPSGPAASWSKILNAQIRKIELKKEQSEDLGEFERLEVEKKCIDRALRDLSHLQALLLPLQKDVTPSEFCSEVQTLLIKLRVRERLVSNSAMSLEANTLELDTRAYRTLLKLLDEIESLLRLTDHFP